MYCKNCGKEFAGTDVFCTKCGTKRQEAKESGAHSDAGVLKNAVEKPTSSPAHQKEEFQEGLFAKPGVGNIVAGIAVFVFCSMLQGLGGSSMFSFSFYKTGYALLDILISISMVPGWIISVGLVIKGIGKLFGREAKTYQAAYVHNANEVIDTSAEKDDGPKQRILRFPKASLSLTDESGIEQKYRIDSFCKSQVLIGRSSECDIVLKSKYVSSVHGAFDLLENEWSYIDLGSTNGSLVNGQMVNGASAKLEKTGTDLIIGGAGGIKVHFVGSEQIDPVHLGNSKSYQSVIDPPLSPQMPDGASLGFMAVQVRSKQDKSFPGILATATMGSPDPELEDGKCETYIFDTIDVKRNGEELFSTGADDIHGTIVVTETRVAIACDEFKKGDSWVGWGNLPMIAIAAAASAAENKKVQKEIADDILVGHIRYEWLSGVTAYCARVLIKLQMLYLVYFDTDGNKWQISITISKHANLSEIYNTILRNASLRKLALLKSITDDERQILTSPLFTEAYESGTKFTAVMEDLPSIPAPVLLSTG